MFGNDLVDQVDPQEDYLKYKDEVSLKGRVARLKYLHRINPDGMTMTGPMELVFTMREIQWSYIEGFYLSTIVLSSALLEKTIHRLLLDKKEKIRDKSLSGMLNQIREKNLIEEYVLDRIDQIRLQRNPITHFKDLEHPHSLDKRSLASGLPPESQLENDAKKAVEISTYLARTFPVQF